MPDIDVVVFDVDDTIYPERDYVRSGFHAVGAAAARHDIEGLGDACWSLFLAGHRSTTFDTALEELGVTPDPTLISELVETYRAHEPLITPRPEFTDLLPHLTGRHLAVLTDGPAVSQRAKTAALGVAEWSELTIYTAELGEGRGKPDPLGFQRIQERFPGMHCCYIADNPAKDFAGPKVLGWSTLRLRTADQLHAGMASGSDVDIEIESLAEVMSHLRRDADG